MIMTATLETMEYSWLERYHPERRKIRGKTYRYVKRVLDLSVVILTSPIWALFFFGDLDLD